MKKYIVFLLIVVSAIIVVACGSVYEREPVGIGREYSELKKSPCACLEIKKAPVLPVDLT